MDDEEKAALRKVIVAFKRYLAAPANSDADELEELLRIAAEVADA